MRDVVLIWTVIQVRATETFIEAETFLTDIYDAFHLCFFGVLLSSICQK